MVYYTDHYGIGEVAADFTREATQEAIERLTPESVARFKANADASAAELAGERQVDVWDAVVQRLMARKRGLLRR